MISVGIDVSKGKSTVCIMKPGGEVLSAPFEITHTKSELLDLINIIKSQNEEVRVVMEDTGHYHLPVATLLVDNDIFVCSVNALRMKKYCSQSIRRAKTDKIDSVHIASYGIAYWNELQPIPCSDDIYKELQLLARQYYQSVALLVKAKVNFSNLLDRVMPNIQSIITDNSSNSKLTDFVARYWHFSRILEMGEKRFISDYCKWAKKKGYRIIRSCIKNAMPNTAKICAEKRKRKNTRANLYPWTSCGVMIRTRITTKDIRITGGRKNIYWISSKRRNCIRR